MAHLLLLPNPAQKKSSRVAAGSVVIDYIEYNPEGSDVQGEYVRIKNTAKRAVNLEGWKLIDEGEKHSYTFPSFSLAAGAEVLLWTKAGEDDASNLYWGSRSAIWNNEGDTAQLIDSKGKVVNTYSYGK